MGTLTKRQTDFAIHFVKSRNIFKSAISAGYSPTFAKSRSHELLKNPLISEKITHLENKYFKDQFQELALDAVKTLSDILADNQNRATQLQSVKYILHEAGITDQPDSDSGTIEIKVTLPKELE